MNDGKLRWGIMGTGNIAGQFARGVREAQRGIMTAIGSRAEPSARKFADEFSIPHAFASYEQLIACQDVDAVYISLPNSMHLEWTLRALAAGKHVLCEKPIGVSAAEAREMFAAAQRAGRVLMEAFMYRSHPLIHAVADSVRNGSIGDVRMIRTSFCYRTQRIDDNIRFDPALGGGALLDIGCYCVDFTRLIMNADPTRVSAVGQLHPTGVDELAAGVMHFPGGRVATFACGMCVQADNTATISGSEGYLEIPVPWKAPVTGAIYRIARSTPPLQDKPGAKSAPTTPPVQQFTVDADRQFYALEADDFAASVLDGVPLRITPEESLANLQILDQLRRDVYGNA